MNQQVQTPETSKNNDVIVDDAFLKSIAMNGPGLVAVVRLPDTKLLFANTQFTHFFAHTNTAIAERDITFSSLLPDYQFERFVNQLINVGRSPNAPLSYVIYKLKNKEGVFMPFYLYAAQLTGDGIAEGNKDLYHLLIQPDLSKWGVPFTSFDTKELFLEQFDSEDFGTFEWIIDIDRVFWSPGVYYIYEVDENTHEIDNVFARGFIHPNDKEKVIDATRRAIEHEEDFNIEFKIITARQNVKILHALARIVRNREGKPIKYAGSIRDVTNQRSIEDDLKNKVEELNHSNRELEEFAYVASHDLQEPLRKITTFSDRLSEKFKAQLTGDGALYLSRIIASAENMRTLINDLLEFSRISKTVQPFEPVNLNFILKQVKTDLELIIEETGTTIKTDELPEIDAISSQMRQLFDNIINNAIKFRKQDIAPVISIDLEVLSDNERIQNELFQKTPYYKITITDNGIGFDAEYATRIFQVFQRLHGKSEYPGSGIGLAICKKILDYHNGIIYAENVPEQGARFIFIIPQHHQKVKGKNV